MNRAINLLLLGAIAVAVVASFAYTGWTCVHW